MKNQGTVVPGENLRGGRRAIKLDRTTSVKCKTTARDRKDTLKSTPIYEDSKAGLDNILKIGKKAYDDLINKVDYVIVEVDEENEILQELRDLSFEINEEHHIGSLELGDDFL